MPLDMGRVLANGSDQTTNTATEYRERFMSPRREDYIPNVALPKINSSRPTASRAFVSYDFDSNTALTPSEYRLCYENFHPKRPYCYHAQPSHVFDYVPKPLDSKPSSRLSAAPSVLKETEYQDRYPNYRSFIPNRELLPPHLTGESNTQSDTQKKRENMSRSQYFHQLVTDSEKLSGGKRMIGLSEQRNSFQWPGIYPPPQQKSQKQEQTPTANQPYYTPRNIYEPLPPIQRPIINSLN